MIIFISTLLTKVYGVVPTTPRYDIEEIKAINQLVYKLIDAERLSSFNKISKPLIYTFDTRLVCDLEKFHFLSYKTNNLIQKLKRKGIADRNIDSTTIRKFEKAKFIFIDNDSVISRMKESENYSGSFSLTRISFNKSFSVGYLFYSVSIDSGSGWGGLIRIEKRNGRWKIIGGPMYVI